MDRKLLNYEADSGRDLYNNRVANNKGPIKRKAVDDNDDSAIAINNFFPEARTEHRAEAERVNTQSDTGALLGYSSGSAWVDDSQEFNIDINFTGDWSEQLQEAFITAADTLSSIITEDIPDVLNFFGETVDDIVIEASLASIDGIGGVLGQASPTYVRSDSYLPVAASMQFDSADALGYSDSGLWDDIVLHEMLHSLGFGALWETMGLIDTLYDAQGNIDYRFNGESANQALGELYPEFDDALGVKVESDGEEGTVAGHWDEEAYNSELMTGYLNETGNVLSAVTIASLEDMGYQTTWGDLLTG